MQLDEGPELKTNPFELPTVESCHYCDRLASREPGGLVEESPLTVTLVNARQHQEGQVVVIPRRHAPTILDLTEQEATEIFLAANSVAHAMTEAYGFDGLLVYQNNGVASGQEVPHFHLHVVPQRFSTSRWGNEPPHVADALGRDFVPQDPIWLSTDEMARVAEDIRSHL